MTTVREGSVEWTFEPGWWVSKYDEWTSYKKHFQSFGDSSKAVDFVAVSPDRRTLWLIEAKDYTTAPRTRDKGPLWLEIATKVRDTLAGLFRAALNGSGDEQDIARAALRVAKIRVVLHLELPRKPTILFGAGLDRADIQQKLRSAKGVHAIDRHPLVVDSTSDSLPWRTARKP